MEPPLHSSDAKEYAVSIRQRWITEDTAGSIIKLGLCGLLVTIKYLDCDFSISLKWLSIDPQVKVYSGNEGCGIAYSQRGSTTLAFYSGNPGCGKIALQKSLNMSNIVAGMARAKPVEHTGLTKHFVVNLF